MSPGDLELNLDDVDDATALAARPFVQAAEESLALADIAVQLRHFVPESVPALLLDDAASRRGRDLHRVREGVADDAITRLLEWVAPSGDLRPRLALNHAHPQVRRLVALSDPAKVGLATRGSTYARCSRATARCGRSTPPSSSRPSTSWSGSWPTPLRRTPRRPRDRVHQCRRPRRARAARAAEPSLRTDPLEQLLPRAEQLGDPLLEADVRIALLSALEFSGRPTEQLLPHFGWLVQAFDDRPTWWSADHDRTVLWTYKWMISHCRNDHRVPLHVVDDMLAGMEERYRRQGRGLAPVLSSRYQVESFVHGAAVAQPAYQAWREAPRTDLSDCAACEPAQSARHLAALGLHERAISEAHPVLAGDLTCMSEPQSIAADVLASLLLADRAQDAAFWHVRAARISRTQPYETGSMATHVEVAARAGQLGRSLELLEERVTDLAAPRHPRDALDLAVAGVVCLDRLLGAGHTDLEVRAPDGVRRPIAELCAALAATAEEHADAFDARNGTDRVGAWVRARIAAPDLPRLPLGPASAPTVEALSALTGAEPSWQPDADPSADEEAALPLMDLWQAHEAAQRRGDSDAGDRIGSAWAARNATDAAWEKLLADHAEAPERALAVLDLTRSALRAAQEPDERLDLLARRGREFARRASGELEEVMIGLSADVARPSILAAHRQDEEAGDADPAPGPRVRTIIERAFASIERVDALVAAGERQLDPSVSPRALARGRATGLPLDPGQRGVLLGEVLQLTSDVTPDSPFGDRWQRAAALVGTSFNQQYGDAEACHEALRLIRPDELAQLRAGAHCQLALVAISHERPDEAADQLERAWELVAPLGGPVTLASVIEHTGRFAPRLDRGRARALLERQLETAARGSRLLAAATAPRICESTSPRLGAGRRRARRAVARGGTAGARRAAGAGRSRGDPRRPPRAGRPGVAGPRRERPGSTHRGRGPRPLGRARGLDAGRRAGQPRGPGPRVLRRRGRRPRRLPTGRRAGRPGPGGGVVRRPGRLGPQPQGSRRGGARR